MCSASINTPGLRLFATETAAINRFQLHSQDDSEIAATNSFKLHFQKNYGADYIHFNSCTLEKAIAETCKVSIESRKILGLYLHNGNLAFSKTFCSSIKSEEIKAILGRSFYLLGWNVAERVYHDYFVKALNACFGPTKLESMVTEGRPVFIMIFAIENQACIFSQLNDCHLNNHKILSALKEVEYSFNKGNLNESEVQELTKVNNNHLLGSVQFQQIMSERLGDRDYDKFESNQHKELKDKIGYAKFGPPSEESGYNKKQQKIINSTYVQICNYSNKYSEFRDQVVLSVVYNCLEPLADIKLSRTKKFPDYDPLSDLLPIPIFVIRKCINSDKPCRLFIDNDDRVYETFNSYLQNNKHPQFVMVLPKDGRYIQDEQGCVILEKYLSPSCGIKSKLLNAADIGSSLLGTLALGVGLTMTFASGIAIAPAAIVASGITGAGVGLYSMVRSGFAVHDRAKYGESTSFANSEARGVYLNIVAGSLGFVGAGATSALSQFAARGVNITKGMKYAVNSVTVLNLTANGVSVGNSTYTVIDDWINEEKVPSALTLLQLTSSILFFANATYNFKMAGRITEEAQINTLKKYENSLRSNRHRKVFNKMFKETIRQNNGNKNVAHAEIISACRKIPDKDTVFSVLTRNNKLFNKEGIHFYAENGQIKLNGISVDLIEFGEMPSAQRSQFLIDVPVMSKPAQAYNTANNTLSIFNTLDIIDNAIVVAKYAQWIYNGVSLSKLLYELLQSYSYSLQEKLVQILLTVLDMLLKQFPMLDEICNKYLSITLCEPIHMVLELILEYIRKGQETLEREYLEEEQKRNGKINNTVKKSVYWFTKFVEMMVHARGINSKFLEDLITYIVNVLAGKIYDYFDKKEEEEECKRTRMGAKTCCTVCGGNYFTAVTRKSFS